MKFELLRQTWAQLRTQRMLTVLSITGSALSIFLIMVAVIMQEVKVMPFAPESNRDRFLHAKNGSVVRLDHEELQSNGGVSYKSALELYGKLKKPEAVTIYRSYTEACAVAVPGGQSCTADQLCTDAEFWKVFDFSFISGKPYNKAEFDAGMPMAVITESIARKLYGSTDAAGREMLVNYAPYRIAGVVKDVSPLADCAYAQVWVPASAGNDMENTWCGDLMGSFCATILAKSTDDFDAIHSEVQESYRQYNKELEPQGWKFVSRNRPYTQAKNAVGSYANVEPDEDAARLQQYIIYLVLLLVPAINLSSMTDSRLRRRMAENGVRRAFGCTRPEMFGQLVGENLLITIAAGIIGWILSIAFAMLYGGFLFRGINSDAIPTVDVGMLVRPSIFLTAILFCFILNLLSSSLPAWRASRRDIVEALRK